MSQIIKNSIPFGKPITDNSELLSIRKVIKSGRYVHGNQTEEFEKKFKKFTNAKYAVTVSSCTAAMHLFYLSYGICKGDEVIVPAQTHVSTAHAVELVGAKPVFVDCELKTGNIDIDKIEKKITKKTKVIAVVHFLGIPVDMRKVKKIAKKYNLLILEDCALALGAKIENKHVGLHGDAGVFSFYPVKHITTAEGGMLITKDKKLSEIVKSKKAFGVDKNYNQRDLPGQYDVKELGLNYRMSEVHAAIGNQQMLKLKKFLEIRKRNFNFMLKNLKDLKNFLILKNLNKNIISSNYSLCLILNKRLLSKRAKIIKDLKNNGVGTSIYYPKPVPLMKYYKSKYGYRKSLFINASIVSENSITLPVGPHISLKLISCICSVLKEILKKY